MFIALSGKAGAGKDTLAESLCKHFGFRRAAFADNLKAAAAIVTGLPIGDFNDRDRKEKHDPFWDMTRRAMAQKLGVAVREVFGIDTWIKSCFRSTIHSFPANDWVITDVRFPNEAAAVRAEGGYVVRVERPGAGLTGEAAKHISEIALDGYPEFDAIVRNDGSLDALGQKTALLYLGLLRGRDGARGAEYKPFTL